MRMKHVAIVERILLVIVLSLGGLIGCASSGSSEPPWPTPRPLGQGIIAYQATVGPSNATGDVIAITEPVGELTLRGAMALALARNPALAAASWEIRSAEADTLQAGLGPNPEVRIGMAAYDGLFDLEGRKHTENRIRLSQVVETSGKASKRSQVGRCATALRGWDYEARRLDVLTQTAKAFISVLVAERHYALAREAGVMAQENVDALAKRAQGGMGGSLDLAEARLDLATSRIKTERAKRALARVRDALAACWGAPKATFTSVAGDLDSLAALPTLDNLLARLDGNPDIARWNTEGQLRQAAVDLEKANAIPDLRFLVGTFTAEDSSNHGFRADIEVEIPIFDRNQGAVSRARFDRIRAAHERHVALLAAQAALREAYEILSASRLEATLLKTDILPLATQRLETSNRGLTAGVVKHSDAMKAQRDLFDAKSNQVGALESFHKALINIERLIAQPIGGAGASAKAPDSAPST